MPSIHAAVLQLQKDKSPFCGYCRMANYLSYRFHSGCCFVSEIISDPQRVALVPTSAGYSVLLSVADPQQFVAALRVALAQP